MNEPAITLKNLLYSNWSNITPNKDNVLETFVPGLVHFTTRYWATNPQRIHNYQISVLAGPSKKTPEEVGSIVMYKVEEQINIHVWAVAGIGDDWETVEANLRTMLDQIDRILRLGAILEVQLGIQFIRITPGTIPRDELLRTRIFHRIVEVTAIYYRTDTSFPIFTTAQETYLDTIANITGTASVMVWNQSGSNWNTSRTWG